MQVLRDPDMGDIENVLAAVGQLQFEVFAYRLGSEFGAPTEIVSAPYQAIRLTDKESADRLRQIGGIRILTRGDGALVRAVREPLPPAAPDERRARTDARADHRRRHPPRLTPGLARRTRRCCGETEHMSTSRRPTARARHAAIDTLLADHPPKAIDDREFRGHRYDAGLAWVHFAEGFGGLGVRPDLNRLSDRAPSRH